MVTGCSKKRVFPAVLKELEPRTRLHYSKSRILQITGMEIRHLLFRILLSARKELIVVSIQLRRGIASHTV